jgi:hypothetical protein
VLLGRHPCSCPIYQRGISIPPVITTSPPALLPASHTAAMNVTKKFDRLKQWTNEKMGAESRTGLSDEFKALELEMNLRHEGMRSGNTAHRGSDC